MAAFSFEWDEARVAADRGKHGLSFDEALTVFCDPQALTFADTDHADQEDRSRTYGVSSKGRLLVVVHTERRDGIRLISACRATCYEKKASTKRMISTSPS